MRFRLAIYTTTLWSTAALIAPRPVRAAEQIRVSIVDGGTDLAHRALSANAFRNARETAGQFGVDDDANGYIDDISGWDLVANDANFFPVDAKRFFKQYADKIDVGFAFNDRMESGDSRAEADLARNETLENITYQALDYAHGTHVAGIVNQTSQHSALLDSANVVTGAEGESDYDQRHALLPNKSASFYSDRTAIDTYLVNSRRENIEWVTSVNRYLRVFNPRLVNLSLGVSYTDLTAAEDEYWSDESAERAVPMPNNLTRAEEKNRAHLIEGLLKINQEVFADMIRTHPQILFVAAAGNSGINSEIEANYPPNLSASYANLLAVATTEDNGQLAVFSSYSKTFIDLAAPGVAIRSTAPANRFVKMSGTSMSAPYVCGVAARVLQINPSLRPLELRNLLNAATQPYEDLVGVVKSAGILVPERAYDLAQKSHHPAPFWAFDLFHGLGNPLVKMFQRERSTLGWDRLSKNQHREARPARRVPKLKFPSQLSKATMHLRFDEH